MGVDSVVEFVLLTLEPQQGWENTYLPKVFPGNSCAGLERIRAQQGYAYFIRPLEKTILHFVTLTAQTVKALSDLSN